jgi:hypothetical protein
LVTTCGYKLDAVEDAIRVSNDGLHELAAQCDAAAAALTSTIAPAVQRVVDCPQWSQ